MNRVTLFFAALLLLAGCSESSPMPHPVAGSVEYRKKPLAGAVVTFHPRPGQAIGHPLTATTGPDGKFRLTTASPNDGAPVGEYAVTMMLLEQRKDGDEVLRNGRNLLPAKYADPARTPLAATVKEGENTLQPFQIHEK